jgi:hypothetical protein
MVPPIADTIPNRIMTHQAGDQAIPRNPNPLMMEPTINSVPKPILAIIGPLLKLTTSATAVDRSISVPIASREIPNIARIDGQVTPSNPALRPITIKPKKAIPMSKALDSLFTL